MTHGLESFQLGYLPDGAVALAYRLALDNGVNVTLTDFGASLIGFCVPDRNGIIEDVVLASDDVASLATSPAYFGAAIGRVAGRIGNARFDFEGETYNVTSNTPPHHLHGGERGLGRRLWSGEVIDRAIPEVRFSICSKDGEEGYPGDLRAELTYRLEAPAKLTLTFLAEATVCTPFNPTCHAYFNLDGHAAGSIEHHRLQIFGSSYTPIDGALIPTGQIESVMGTPFDFTREISILRRRQDPQSGFDHNFVIDPDTRMLRRAAVLRSSQSGRTLSVFTDRPCLHLYTGSALCERNGKNGAKYGPMSGLALETQGYPDALNHSKFLADIVGPNGRFFSQTIFDFNGANLS